MFVRLIEDIRAISKSQVHRILDEYLKVRKVCARFVPHSLRHSTSTTMNFKRVLKKGENEHQRLQVTIARTNINANETPVPRNPIPIKKVGIK